MIYNCWRNSCAPSREVHFAITMAGMGGGSQSGIGFQLNRIKTSIMKYN